MEVPNDAELTENGLAEIGLAEIGVAAADGGKLLVIACGALAREILALKKINGWEYLSLICLPAKLHLYPDQIPDAVAEAVAKYRANFDQIFIGYADCGTGGLLQARCAELGVEMLSGPHCYSFFDGNKAFAERADDEFTSFYLTDFLARQFDAFVWKPMGFDKHPELIPMMFGNYEKLVYLAQLEDPALDQMAQEAAAKLGLTYERRVTGYGDLASELSAWHNNLNNRP